MRKRKKSLSSQLVISENDILFIFLCGVLCLFTCG